MAAASASKFMSQAEFARRRGISAKSVTIWKQKGLVILNDAGMVDVEETEWKLDQQTGDIPRRRRPPSGSRSRPEQLRSEVGEACAGHEPGAPGPQTGSDRPSDGAPDPTDFDWSDPNLPMAEAVRRKENFLGLTRKHEFEVAKGEWVRVEDVGREVEREYAVVRERLLAMPGKLASKLEGLDRTAIELVLIDEVTEALNELHVPDAGDGFDRAA